ncbi:MAG: hypothetical protein J6K45_07605 [Clostridia bacterium]|nr:hypothetical protein [Clostridia bacterium]MBP3464323.1 hypothetical protein [Clostridia bacterium]
MPKDRVVYYNQIDIGILELCLNKNNIFFDRQLFVEENLELEKNLIVKYLIK